MIVISNASPIIALSAIRKISLVETLYEQIVIPQAVYGEIAKGEGQPGQNEIQTSRWIVTRTVNNVNLVKALQTQLDPGEAETITLAVDLQADLVLIDERRARLAARRLGLNVIGVLGILVEAKQKKLIDTIEPVLDELVVKAGFRISSELYRHILETVGEKTQRGS